MNIVTTCIGELPEELREAAIKEQRERRRNVNIYYPFLSDPLDVSQCCGHTHLWLCRSPDN